MMRREISWSCLAWCCGVLALGNGLAKLTRGTAVTVNTVLGGPTYSDGGGLTAVL